MNIENIVVAISGGGGRLGSAFAKSIVKNGGKVALGDINENAKNLIDKLGEDNAIFINEDLTKADKIQKFVDKTTDKFGSIDGAIHCSYPVSHQWGTKFEDLDQEYLNQDLSAQIGGAIMFSQKILNHF